MAPRKLSDSDKGTIVELYKQPGQTTSTLAEQYGVSNSTISRILKMSIPADEYRALVSQKRMGGGAAAQSSASASASAIDEAASGQTRKRRSRRSSAAKEAEAKEANANQTAEDESAAAVPERTSVAPPKIKTAAEKAEAKSKSSTRRRRRRSAKEEDEQLPLLSEDGSADSAVAEESVADTETLKEMPVSPIAASDSFDDDDDDDLTGLDETLGDDFGEDDDDDLDDEDDLDDLEDETAAPKPKLQSKSAMQIMPLGEAVLPKPCYLVVDMRAELITRPLIEFADLGQVPSEEERAKTLPVFDNHRVARRFSRNKQRVIKVPDGSLITRTSPYLAAKGITRLLVDGQVFDLASAGTR